MKSKAKRHQILKDVATEMSGRHITKDVEIDGHRFTLRTLKPSEADWAITRMPGSGGDPTKMVLLQSKPIVAASIQAIDGVPVEELFALPDDMDTDVKEALISDGAALREWRRDQVLDFVLEDLLDDVVGRLWHAYAQLRESEAAAVGEVEKKVVRVSGGSDPTSLPEKESSPQTQA